MLYTENDKLKARASLLGFGLMRLPTDKDGNIDEQPAAEMIDRAYQAGVNYFDTAYGYLNSQSEGFAGRFLCRRYPRDSFYLADKLPLWECRNAAEAEKIYQIQMERMQTDYVDFHLLHAVNKERFEMVKAGGIDQWQEEKKAQGIFHRIGFSFHDKPEVLDEILSYKSWDFCQIQMNYLDYDIYESKAQYDICRKHGVPFVVMEPIKGGTLANPHADVKALFKQYRPDLSPAALALRFVASLDGLVTILSGMSAMEQLEENLKTLSTYRELSPAEEEMYEKARAIFKGLPLIPCTSCKYCEACPAEIEMWQLFTRYNNYISYNNADGLVKYIRERDPSKLPPACICCHHCEEQCPQHIKITEEIQKVYALACELAEAAASS